MHTNQWQRALMMWCGVSDHLWLCEIRQLALRWGMLLAIILWRQCVMCNGQMGKCDIVTMQPVPGLCYSGLVVGGLWWQWVCERRRRDAGKAAGCRTGLFSLWPARSSPVLPESPQSWCSFSRRREETSASSAELQVSPFNLFINFFPFKETNYKSP